MESKYFICLEIEILNEIGASVISSYSRFIDEKGINMEDNKNPIMVIYRNLVILKNNLFSYESFDELKMVEGEFRFAKKCLENLKEV